MGIFTSRFSAQSGAWDIPVEVVAPFDRANGTCARSQGGMGCKFAPSLWNPVLVSVPARLGFGEGAHDESGTVESGRGVGGGGAGVGAQGGGSGSWGGLLGKLSGGGGGSMGGREELLFYKTGPHPSEWTGYLTRSRDGGTTWSAPHERLPDGIVGPSKNKPLVLPATGALLVPSSRESGRGAPRNWTLVMEESGDGGRTWTRHSPLRFDGNAIQPALW